MSKIVELQNHPLSLVRTVILQNDLVVAYIPVTVPLLKMVLNVWYDFETVALMLFILGAVLINILIMTSQRLPHLHKDCSRFDNSLFQAARRPQNRVESTAENDGRAIP